jgi:Ni/Co efflux regulator RcnB
MNSPIFGQMISQAHRLTEPPPGHQWVQAGSDFALVAIATGVVTEVLVGR